MRSSSTDPKLSEKRQKRGECPTCGIKLYRKAKGVLGGKRVPITIEGHVENGRCLTCNPAKKEPQAVPEDAVMEDSGLPQVYISCDDNATVISALTLDRHLMRPPTAEDDEFTEITVEENNQQPAPASASVRGRTVDHDESSFRPEPPKRMSGDGGDLGVPSAFEVKDEIIVEVSGRQERSSGSAKNSITANEAARKPIALQEEREIFFDSSRLCDLETAKDETEPPSPKKEIDISFSPPAEGEGGNESLDLPKWRRPTGKHGKDSIKKSSMIDVAETEDYSKDRLQSLVQEMNSKETPTLKLMEAVPIQLWKGGKEARGVFQECNGFQALTQILWGQMSHEPLEERAVEIFLAAVASDEDQDVTLLASEDVRSSLEALLFVMQSLSHNDWIQICGARALTCLATSNGLSEGQVDDGSNSGAPAVLLASFGNSQSSVVKKWTCRALFRLCTVSTNAEPNKKMVLAADEAATFGQCLEIPEAVQLVWCLSASEDAKQSLNADGSLAEGLIRILRESDSVGCSHSHVEALLGATNNLIVVSESHAFSKNLNELIELALRSIQGRTRRTGLCTEATALIANVVAGSATTKQNFVEKNGISTITSMMQKNLDPEAPKEGLHEEYACCLLNASIDCEIAKAEIRKPKVFSTIKRLSRLYEGSVRWQELLCCLIASVVVTSDPPSSSFDDIEKDAVSVLCFALTLYPDEEKIAESCCVGLRNISSREDSRARAHLLSCDALELVIDVMHRHSDSKVAVKNVCGCLWSMGFNGDHRSNEIVSSLIKAMRANLDEAELLHSSLAVLLRLLVGSDDNKRAFCEVNGIEVATSIMLIHRGSESLLIKACGLLASLSCCSELVPQIVDAGGVTFAIEMVRSESPSTPMLLSATQFLTNAVLAMPGQCEEVGGTVNVLIERMRECPQEVDFQSEACRLMWAVASLSETVRSRILALDGVAVLMATLENNKATDVQNNALEAFNELAAC